MHEPTAPERKPGTLRWPLIIVGLLASQALMCFYGVMAATRDRSFAVETDYHRRALQWDALVARQRASRLLGWQPRIELRGRHCVLSLRDARGASVGDATVSVQYFHHARAAEVQSIELAPSPTGDYMLPDPLQRDGVWEFRILARAPGAVFTDVIRQDVRFAALAGVAP